MDFKQHTDLIGKHAFLSPSNYHWIRYTPEKLRSSYLNSQAIERGIKLHKLAQDCINNRVNLPKVEKTLNMYVNDAIGYRMTTEQPLVYSENCFGTADAICYRDRMLRIHDLKTGVTKANMLQLEIYAALFFLEYRRISLDKTEIELRIYQSNKVTISNPDKATIRSHMDQIILADKEISQLKEV